MSYFTLVRLYYLNPKGVRAIAPANTVVSDMNEDAALAALEAGYIREATVGEMAESQSQAEASAPKKARAAKPKADADTTKAETVKADAGKSDTTKADADKSDDLA